MQNIIRLMLASPSTLVHIFSDDGGTRLVCPLPWVLYHCPGLPPAFPVCQFYVTLLSCYWRCSTCTGDGNLGHPLQYLFDRLCPRPLCHCALGLGKRSSHSAIYAARIFELNFYTSMVYLVLYVQVTTSSIVHFVHSKFTRIISHTKIKRAEYRAVRWSKSTFHKRQVTFNVVDIKQSDHYKLVSFETNIRRTK